MKVMLAANRTIEGVLCKELQLRIKQFHATATDNLSVPIIGGATAMTWRLLSPDNFFTTVKPLTTLGEDLQDVDIKDRLIAEGWILEEDTLIM